jgi:hypothetical protein
MYSLGTRYLAPRVDSGRERNPTELVGQIIQIEVRNASGIPDLARRATAFLRERGFDVVEIGNYPEVGIARSRVIDRVGDRAAALKVARAIGIADEHVLEEISQDYFLDASVVIGLDYETLAPFDQE